MLFALFLGPWSDRAGRKLLILLPFVGYALGCVVFLVNVYFFDELYVEFLWFEAVSACFGSWTLFFIGCYGYLADTTSPESRTIRIAIMDGCFFGVEIVANYLNAPLYKRFDYFGSFGMGLLCYILGLLLVLITFKETKKEGEAKGGRNMVSLSDLANSFMVLVKKREGGMRHIVILLIVAFTCNGLTYTGVDFLFFRKNFDFSGEDELITWYTHLRSYTAIGDVIALFIVLPILVKTLQLHDLTIVILSALAHLSKSLIYYAAQEKSLIYVTIAFCLVSPLCTQPLRSSMTKIAGQGDVGAIFACVAALQAISGFATPLYNMVYSATLDEFSGRPVYLVTCVFHITMVGILGYTLAYLKRREWKDPTPNVTTTSYIRRVNY